MHIGFVLVVVDQHLELRKRPHLICTVLELQADARLGRGELSGNIHRPTAAATARTSSYASDITACSAG